MKDYSGVEFLDKLYQNLYMSEEVQHTREDSDKRKVSIQKYMDRLERVHKKATTDSRKEILYNLYFNKYVINEKDIPYGMDKEAIINSQKKSLGMWLDYLSDATTNYPMWAKYWAFQGMLKMGSYDETKEVYLKRNKKTISPFVPANAEIIAKSIETIINLVEGKEITEDIEEKLNKMDSFNKIYSIFEKKYKSNIVDKSNIEGIWKKYNQGSKEDAIGLSKSLENMNTGWCTASEDMAIKQICGPYSEALNGGDFYVYYTKDNNANYKIPRIAIRLNGKNEIGEIRGIEDGQNLEEKMIDTLENKLKEMSFLLENDVKRNLQIVEDLRQLTKIGKMTENKEQLTEKELINLYTKKFGFGWIQDPRVGKIIEKRDKLEDYNKINDQNIKIMFLVKKFLPEGTIINDRKIIMEAVKQNTNALKYISKELKSDREYMLEAVKKDGLALQYVSEELKEDKEIALEAVKQNGIALRFVSEELKKDKEVVLEAVKQEGYAINFVSEELKKDKEVVLETVRQEGYALKYVPEELRKDKEVVLEAIKQNAYAINFASEELKNDKEFMSKINNNEQQDINIIQI